ncbi:MAG: nitroreductase family protein [Bacteroidales bacterium]|nr:nitroreductase family protein [Bacteroidales bacterium]MCF8391930.1 nitroreductase family protein [Bacteroidales bacterium]
MDFEEIIISRRSIRKYTDEKIDTKTIIRIINAAMYAPSAVNKRPWNFVIIEDKSSMKKVMEIHASARMLKEASHAILICGDEKQQHDDGFWIADCGAATQNMLLAAHSFGIGGCWIGVYPREKRMNDFAKLFNLPEHIKPFALVSLGFPAENKEMPQRFEKEKIYYELWGKQME